MRRLAFGLVVAALVAASPVRADQVNVAVAANFTAAAKEIASAFKVKTGHDAVLSFGSSGQFLTQIVQGAPFQVFLSADEERPKKLAADGFGVSGSVFTYAVGKLVLWSRKPGVVTGEETLRQAGFDRLALCNPTAAPYGAAAIETLKSLKLHDRLQPKFVMGANISQAYQYVVTGNAEIGFVAYSQVVGDKTGSSWMVPQDLYKPIRQDAVLLKTGAGNDAAKAFIGFLKGPEAKAVIARYGYAPGEGD